LIGETLGRYQITEHLGRGGMAEVYKAYQPHLERHVAIKVLYTFLASEDNFLARFQREAKAVAALRHSNIIQVYDFDYNEEQDLYYMVMEFVDGPNLKTRLQELAERGEQMPLDEAIRIVAAVGEALDYAHERGMIHRDIKPANIMFTSSGQIILTDFGIARMVNLSGLTASGAVMGTPSYISPEQAMGRAGDERADIYSLGIVFYQLITGDLPFDAETSIAIILKHVSEPPPSPRILRPDLPEMVEKVLMRALAKDTERRYQTVAEFVADLRLAATGQTLFLPPQRTAEREPAPVRTVSPQMAPTKALTPPTSPAPTPIPVPTPRRRQWGRLVALGALFILLLGTVGILAFTNRDRLGDLLGSLGLLPTDVGTSTPVVAVTQMAETLAAMQATMGAPTHTPIPTSTSIPTSTPTPTPTPDLTAIAIAACVFDIEVVSDTPVQPSVLVPGQQFVKHWEIENTGTCAWPESVQLVFVSGEELEIVEGPEIEPLAPGEATEIEITLQSPADYDAYTSVWQLQDGEGNPIGGDLEIAYRVDATPTPRPTAMPTATPTPELTSTPVERLSMSVPSLNDCDSGRTKGRIGWAFGGGPSAEYRYFYSQAAPEYELPGPYYDFTGFPQVVTCFVSSGTVVWPIPRECGRGDYGWCEGPGYEIVWRKVLYGREDCP
jgi:serine/threonine protein kinase